jgi:hypothetical protein
MFASSQKTEASAVRSLSLNEIEAVAGGFYAGSYEPIGDRRVVGCGTMVLIDRMIKVLTGRGLY